MYILVISDMLISRGWTVDVGANIGERSGDMMDGMIAMEQKINEAALDMISYVFE